MQDGSRSSHSLLVVPSGRSDLESALRKSLADPGVQVITDRRRDLPERSAVPERRHPERRRRDPRPELSAGRWVVVPLGARQIDFADADDRAVLFLCCSEHAVPCQTCQDTYRIRWVRRDGAGTNVCPRCAGDLTAAIAAHTVTCAYWVRRDRASTRSAATAS